MATDAKAFTDDWTGEADPDGLTEAEENALIDAALESVRLRGTVSHNEAMRRIAAFRTRRTE